MKRIISLLLTAILTITILAPLTASAEIINPIIEYTFDEGTKTISNVAKGGNSAYIGTLMGNAKLVSDSYKGRVLYLDGSDDTYMEFSNGTFDNRDEMTISLDVKSELNDSSFFTLAYGVDSTKYAFLRVRGYETCFVVARTPGTDESYAGALKARTGKWHNISIVVNNGINTLYVNGVKVAQSNRDIKTSELGTNLKAYLGKSFYEADPYFKGYFDNVRIYDKALSESELLGTLENSIPFVSNIVVGTTVDASSKGSDDHTASNTIIDNEALTITPYVRKTANISALPMTVSCVSSECVVKLDGAEFKNGSTVDLSKERKLSITYNDITQVYTIMPASIAYNAVLPGQYGDPDIDYIDGKYWMFPTTDGYDWWNSTQFHAFSSPDLINWTDEGVVLDVADKNPGLNAKGVQIASCLWSNINAWAPSVEAKNGKCYLYFCGNYTLTDRMAIGVAVADNPAGPYKVNDMPLIYSTVPGDQSQLPEVAQSNNLFVNDGYQLSVDDITFKGQTIDPSIFTDDDGTSYILFGNGTPAYFKLNADMVSVDPNSYKRVNKGKGLDNYCESIYCIKRNGIYHFTWSCNGTDDERYLVGYGTATSFSGDVTYQGTLLRENEEIGALCTAHQSLVYRKDIDKCYIAYHRFYTPLGIYQDQYGKHREACVDEVTFDANGIMRPVTATMQGVAPKPVAQPTKPVSTTTTTKPATTTTTKPTTTAVKPPISGAKKNADGEWISTKVKKPTIKKLAKGKKSFTVYWGKITKIKGYQIQYSTSSKFKKSASKKITVTSYKTVKKVVKKLKGGKKYYVRIRAYKLVNNKKVYSSWSKAKSITTKK